MSVMPAPRRKTGGHPNQASPRTSRKSPSTWVFYTVQGQPGDADESPNVFRVTKRASELRLKDVMNAFPLIRHTGAPFHFRFKVAAGGGAGNVGHVSPAAFCFLDLTNPEDHVPLYQKQVHLKALRLGTSVRQRVYVYVVVSTACCDLVRVIDRQTRSAPSHISPPGA